MPEHAVVVEVPHEVEQLLVVALIHLLLTAPALEVLIPQLPVLDLMHR